MSEDFSEKFRVGDKVSLKATVTGAVDKLGRWVPVRIGPDDPSSHTSDFSVRSDWLTLVERAKPKVGEIVKGDPGLHVPPGTVLRQFDLAFIVSDNGRLLSRRGYESTPTHDCRFEIIYLPES